MKQLLVVCAVLALACVAAASTLEPVSAVRLPTEDYRAVMLRFEQKFRQQAPLVSPVNAAIPYKDLTFDNVTEWDLTALNNTFQAIRDLRAVLPSGGMRDKVPRRLSHLYPHDGCFYRSLGKSFLSYSLYGKKLSTLFIFGNLNVKTKYSAAGSVSWWYHTVPIAKVDGKIYVFDVALNWYSPTLLEDWVLLQVKSTDSVKIAVCNPFVWHPNGDCNQAFPEKFDPVKELYPGITSYINYETTNLKSVSRPFTDVHDCPPWKENTKCEPEQFP